MSTSNRPLVAIGFWRQMKGSFWQDTSLHLSLRVQSNDNCAPFCFSCSPSLFFFLLRHVSNFLGFSSSTVWRFMIPFLHICYVHITVRVRSCVLPFEFIFGHCCTHRCSCHVCSAKCSAVSFCLLNRFVSFTFNPLKKHKHFQHTHAYIYGTFNRFRILINFLTLRANEMWFKVFHNIKNTF